MNWQEQIRTQGYARFGGLTPEPLVTEALQAIQLDLERNYAPQRQVEYDNQSYCPDLRGTPPIMNLLTESPTLELLDQAIGVDKLEPAPATCDLNQLFAAIGSK